MEKLIVFGGAGYYMRGNDTPAIRGVESIRFDYRLEIPDVEDGYSIINGNRYYHAKNKVLVIGPGDIKYSSGSFNCFHVHFNCEDQEFIKNYLSHLNNEIILKDPEKVINITKELSDASKREFRGKSLFLYAKTLEIISILYTICKTDEKKAISLPKYQNDIYKAQIFMSENYAERVTLEDISRAANLSPGYFHTLFKEIIGITPLRYLMNIRIQQAKQLLVNTAQSISSIAVSCGFGSQAYMTYIFNKELNITPKKYRDEYTMPL